MKKCKDRLSKSLQQVMSCDIFPSSSNLLNCSVAFPGVKVSAQKDKDKSISVTVRFCNKVLGIYQAQRKWLPVCFLGRASVYWTWKRLLDYRLTSHLLK